MLNNNKQNNMNFLFIFYKQNNYFILKNIYFRYDEFILINKNNDTHQFQI
jgi:hypothetical protein